jgi:thiamine pyrophosphokinase
MNIEDIEKTLPNGFHDAILQRLNIDYINKIVELDLNVWVGDLNSKNENIREEYKKMRLKLKRFLFFIIEKPDHTYPYSSGQELMIDMGKISSLKERHNLKNLMQSIPKEAFAYWIFISQWNSFIYFSALDAEFEKEQTLI